MVGGERIAYKDIYHRPVYSRGIRMKGRKGEKLDYNVSFNKSKSFLFPC